MSPVLPFVLWAHDAADAAGEWARDLARVDPEVPLAAFPSPVVALSGVAERAAETLRLTAKLAAAEADGKTGRSGDAPRKLREAMKRTVSAVELLDEAWVLIGKHLRRAEIGEDPDEWPLRPTPSRAYSSLAHLNGALDKADPQAAGTLDGLALVVEQEILILKAARRPCLPVAEGIRSAYRAMPPGAVLTRPKAAEQLHHADTALGQAAVWTGAAGRALGEARDQTRRNTGAAR